MSEQIAWIGRRNDYANAAVLVSHGMQEFASTLVLGILIHSHAAFEFVRTRDQSAFLQSIADKRIEGVFRVRERTENKLSSRTNAFVEVEKPHNL